MITTVVSCTIRCKQGARAKLNTLANQFGAVHVRAETFLCTKCNIRWQWLHFSGYNEPDTVTCSNCYRDNVLITSACMEIPDAKEVGG